MSFTAAEIAKHLEGEVLGDGQTQLNAFAPVDRAKAGDLTFAENEEFFAKAEQSAASGIIVSGIDASNNGKVLICVKNARVAFARALTLFFPEPSLPAGVHSSATVAAWSARRRSWRSARRTFARSSTRCRTAWW